MKQKITLAALGLVIGLAGWGTACAAPVVFFGEDAGLGESTRLTTWANSSAAQSNFYSNLAGVRTEDFEAMSGSVANFGGGLTATISGGTLRGLGGYCCGRYPISGTHYWEATNNFTLDFSTGISAFGFYGVDIGDFNGQVVLTMANGGGTTTLNIGNSVNVRGGGVLYFGFYDLEDTYNSITFSNTASGIDYFAFDDFTIGTINNVRPTSPVPEPETYAMLLAGLGLLSFTARRRKQAV